MVRRLNVEGDGQGDLVGHGGEHRAVFVYQIPSYRYWQTQFGRNDFVFGQFGENFTVDGVTDDEVCIGDRYRIGSALFEVTQPRVTCYRIGIRMNEPRMAALLVAHGRPGFYFRVLEEGEVAAGDEIIKVTEGPERMSVADINALLYLPGHSRQQLVRALRIPALSVGWQSSLRALLDREYTQGIATGNPGLASASGPPPAWDGFRPVRVSRIDRESSSVNSFVLEPADGLPLVAALPGQFVVLRLQPDVQAPPLLRSYSLSAAPSSDRYRVSVKREENGAASIYLHNHARVGDVLEVSAPRGSFTLRPGDGPVVLLSAGVGANPRCLQCCTRWLLRRRRAMCGGSTEHATATIIRLPQSHGRCFKRSRTAAATYSTAGPVPTIGVAPTSTRQGTSRRRSWTRFAYLTRQTFTCVDPLRFCTT